MRILTRKLLCILMTGSRESTRGEIAQQWRTPPARAREDVSKGMGVPSRLRAADGSCTQLPLGPGEATGSLHTTSQNCM